jgi:hypothetical protein
MGVCVHAQSTRSKPKTHIFYIEIIKRGEWDSNPQVMIGDSIMYPTNQLYPLYKLHSSPL